MKHVPMTTFSAADIGRPTASSTTLRRFTTAAALASAVLLAACAPATRVILLPQADGSPSAVSVTTEKGTQEVNKPYQTAEVSGSGGLSSGQSSAEEVKEDYGQILSLQLPDPERFTLQFQPGTSTLTPESEALLPTILQKAEERSGGEIIITGHTDRQGSLEDNDALSLKRAQAIRELFIARGFKAELIEAVGRGEREPAVPTEDDVAEPQNRRAELLVR
ncbi:OmpA family protein [Hydrogenophaga sp. 5NK40-0174]|uniref:OmpA family protein n=1 Tax=Hydrogenophaga sp. 5NK40-0174 TaxID=3127649 RepID=UPI00310A9BBA